MTPHTERHTVLRAQSGEREAFDALLRDVGPALLRYVTRVAGEGLAEDVLQETFILIVRKLQWLSDPSLFRPWAYRIASREAFRALKKRRMLPHEPIDENLAVEVPEIDPWQRERLLSSLQRLSPASRAVITLHYLEELPLGEVAAVLELPLGTVKSRLAYGLAQLRKEKS